MIDSCIGTVTKTGTQVVALPSAESEAHVSGAAIRAKQLKKDPWSGAPNSILRAEPTWGDVDVLVTILVRLRPNNAAQLLAAFSSCHSSAKAIQLIRNGAAHNHNQNLAEIQSLGSAYLVFPIIHPTHAMFWINPKSSNFLIIHAIQDLIDTGLAAIS